MCVIIGDQKFLTTKEVAERLGVTQRTVVRWANRQKEHKKELPIKFIKHPFTGHILFLKKDIENLIANLLSKI